MSATFARDAIDLDACANEPIHIPGSVQPHGVLLCLTDAPELRIERASENLPELTGVALPAALGRGIDALFGAAAAELAQTLTRVAIDERPALVALLATPNGARFEVSAHRHAGALILELEPAPGGMMPALGPLYVSLRRFLQRFESSREIDELARIAAEEVRALSGFDRVLVYRFDEQWHGTVIAESRGDRLPSYLGLRFPASDIPRQARDLYLQSRLRMIAAADYRPARIVCADGVADTPLDLGHALLRSVSPVHLEYMRNMGVGASMSTSIVVRGRLWGLISCHHAAPARLGADTRTACEHLTQVLSLQLESRHETDEAAQRHARRGDLVQLLAAMAEHDDFTAGLQRRSDALLGLVQADGAAILTGEACTLIGATPAESDVRAIVDWLTLAHPADLHATDCLSQQFSAAETCAGVASGLLAISLSNVHRSHVLWFRREVVRTIDWAGNPEKPLETEGGAVDEAALGQGEQPPRLHPRKSFARWRELVQRRSLPWSGSQIEVAAEFRTALLDIVLRKAEELAQAASDLKRANKELEAFSYSVSHDLRAPLRHVVGYAELLAEVERDTVSERGRRYLAAIADSARYAGTLVDNLLSFSQMGRASLQPVELDLGVLVREVVASLEQDRRAEHARRRVEWRIEPLPTVRADVIFLRLALENLLSNALKYTRGRESARIEVAALPDAQEHVIRVRDNGVGFDMRYVGKLFGVFQRLHRMEDYEGTGIGLANVRRIIGRHGGRTWAEGEPGVGASFYFSLPKHSEGPGHAQTDPAR